MSFIKPPNQISGKEYILDSPGESNNFLQFIPATVKQVINSGEAAASPSNNDNESNCIIVEKNILNDDVTLGGTEARKYRPLVRGFADSVTKNDLVLVTVVGNVGYYLGPLNTTNTPSATESDIASISGTDGSVRKSATYPVQTKFNRLIKQFRPDLDDPEKTSARITSDKTGNEILSDIHTDMILEGRHGNSIRIGSRNRFPNLIINNGRNTNQSFESINDSSIFAMIHQGGILEHFRPEDENLDNEPYAFKFADESIENPVSFIKASFKSPLGRGESIDGSSDDDIEETIYGYTGAFSILNSDRIIINARKENMFISAFNHLHLGCGDSMTFSTSKNTLFNSTERFDINAPEVRLGSAVDDETEPIVLGDTLVTKLTELCSELETLISTITAITVPTTQGPSGTPINAASFTPISSNIASIKNTLEDFLSTSNRTT